MPIFSDIINSLIKTGFTIEKIVEPEPVEEKFGTYCEIYPVEILKMVPNFLSV